MTTKVRNPLTGKELDLGIGGVASGWDPTTLSRSRIAIVGKTGTGKSTLLHSSPTTFVLDTEKGGRSVACPQCFRFPEKGVVANLAAYKEVVRALISRKPDGVETVGVDTLDALAALVGKDICQRFKVDDVGDACGGYGKGHNRLVTEVFDMLDSLHDAGFGVAVLAHVHADVIKTKGGDIIQQNISLTQKLRTRLVEWADHILWLESGTTFAKGPAGKMVTQQVKQLRTTVGGNWKGDQKENIKTRLPLPETIVVPPQHGWAHLSLEFDTAIRTLTEGYVGIDVAGVSRVAKP